PFFNRKKTQLIFRGHRRFDWALTPSLGRLDAKANVITRETAEAQLDLFRRAVRGRVSDRSLVEAAEADELWSVGQHHGLMTPLLDWTYSPYVALFFAFEMDDPAEGETDNPYRALYVLNKSHVEVEDQCPDVSVLEPRKDDHGRLVNQAGLFTKSSYGETLEVSLINSLQDEVLANLAEDLDVKLEARELAGYLCKIYIPNEKRIECLRHLRMMNVHHASLFPDVPGAAQYCNVMVAEEVMDRREAAFESSEDVTTAEVSESSGIEVGGTAADDGELGAIDPSGTSDVASALRAVLAAHPDAGSVEAPRLSLIADELAKQLRRRQYVDWEKRESVQASMRTAARVVMRRLGYPVSARDEVLDKVLDVLRSGEEGIGP
ncbi:MAG: FRG domain-containing protein, partial [Gammaproteobacteria bacterium]